jgi:hypothetical protein
MILQEREWCVQFNWIAIVSHAASLALSLAIWVGLLRVVHHLMK